MSTKRCTSDASFATEVPVAPKNRSKWTSTKPCSLRMPTSNGWKAGWMETDVQRFAAFSNRFDANRLVSRRRILLALANLGVCRHRICHHRRNRLRSQARACMQKKSRERIRGILKIRMQSFRWHYQMYSAPTEKPWITNWSVWFRFGPGVDPGSESEKLRMFWASSVPKRTSSTAITW